MSTQIVFNVFIAKGQTQGWATVWQAFGWQGNTFVQPAPVTIDTTLSYTNPAISVGPDGKMVFEYSITNSGPSDFGWYSLELSVG